MSSRYAIVLAAGKGTRMRSTRCKVLHEVCGKPMIQHIVDRLHGLGIHEIILIVGHGAEQVKNQFGASVRYAYQSEQLGTAHAVMMAADLLQDKQGTTIVLSGDTPLVREKTLEQLLEQHETQHAAATVLTARVDDPTGYGRLIRDANGLVERIVEHKDATAEERQVCEINTGMYCFDNQKLFQAISRVKNDNAQKEYYLPDVLTILNEQNECIGAFMTDDAEEGTGVNDRIQLACAERLLRMRINEQHMQNGVTIIDPTSTYIDADVCIGPDTVIHPGTYLRGKTKIGPACVIGPNADVSDCIVGGNVEIRYTNACNSTIRDGAVVGPYAYIRPGSDVGEVAKVGDFVELKNSRLGKGAKVAHLSYIGDSDIGEHVNVGCGTITVNYDGVRKHKTIVGDHAFIGCNANLIAPVTIGEGAYVAAGSTITDDVPNDALAIARERQSIKEQYAKRLMSTRP
ncbi:bifunctional UDP-N-acetylglucosamine diphosphorylase/glucosamine-1-phosphate N-acetyltransferase GlmU [Brevibacillus formosus]|uniref:Bifunctional protein GlmU n=1 Tax=Brevibacillus formosus TaxID=54913 RepID=A0A837KRF2_9BACL|nr:bifunctional UDP-N-acetylglucosamine diphosphorylase/glucosamine-1-phosphate N-acetyltransferase GlmU [Brevibacillus formosus]KLH99521.1 bifunctional N-acetylglucosamine-1-phosphate uridyltransferase/glucosamine-1-phosphate acetyltransferase [Brevibacillus formosus]MED1959943.1 bifunctional UDP-N-acetylglucosamine diphosphorylase/glucosamine-1-phosphate N-acetyltransferase GlmU [Brevibacillus formosus]PSJ95568.1 bifunctional UDP-N-acetylglucosamine diphosphorylase/glucosamine-1-phosphate N-ac